MTAKQIRAAAAGNATAIEPNASDTTSSAGGPAKKRQAFRFHAFKIVQYSKHLETGEVLMTPAQLQVGLDHRSIKKWAWIEHDQDVKNDGSLVPPHIHIALQCKDARSREQIAKWFGVPVDLVNPLGGRGAFISYVRYLTHEDPNQQALGKHRYLDSSVVANFDWRSEVDAHFSKSMKLPTRLEDVKVAVLRGELALWEVREAEPHLYVKNRAALKVLAEDCREAHIQAGKEIPGLEDMKLRIRTGVTMAGALDWIADRLRFEGDTYDRRLRASNVVMGKEEGSVDAP
jgi:hypothetical protein